MPGCGYICPKCNDSGFDDEGKTCEWCLSEEKPAITVSDEEWMERVHSGPCCGDLGQANPDRGDTLP